MSTDVDTDELSWRHELPRAQDIPQGVRCDANSSDDCDTVANVSKRYRAEKNAVVVLLEIEVMPADVDLVPTWRTELNGFTGVAFCERIREKGARRKQEGVAGQFQLVAS
jgi:hypothetical protein